MATFALNEQLVTALAAKLTAQLPAAITEINAAVTDGFTITNPVEVLDYVPDEREISAKASTAPLVGIQDVTSTFKDDIGSSVTGQHAFAVLVWLYDPSRQALARKLRRYQRALATVCLAGRAISTIGYGVTLRNAAPGPTLEREEDPRGWVSFTGVVIQSWVDEQT
jgi:hypothetical protein